ncbi:MAG: peroxiredoxin-like family protein [Pseudomonadales bacterium]
METEKTDFLEKLARLRATQCEQIPTPQMAVLTRLTARLRRSGILSRCIQPGESAPDFKFVDATGNRLGLYGLLEHGPVVINFFRGLWCPYCKTELLAFESIRDRLTELGCRYLAITPQKPPPEYGPPNGYELIFDQDNRIARQFDLVYTLSDEEAALFAELGVQIEKLNESNSRQLPIPATYVIAKDRTVAYLFVDVDFRSRCCPDDLIEEVKAQLR